LLGIALLLFFEDLAEALLVEALAVELLAVELLDVDVLDAALTEVWARPLVAPRLAADGFFELLFEPLLELLETLFLRVFCDTACARNRRAPVRCFTGTPGASSRHDRIQLLNVPIIAHFP
jgi:hypothetical protein